MIGHWSDLIPHPSNYFWSKIIITIIIMIITIIKIIITIIIMIMIEIIITTSP